MTPINPSIFDAWASALAHQIADAVCDLDLNFRVDDHVCQPVNRALPRLPPAEV